MRREPIRLFVAALLCLGVPAAWAQCPSSVPVQGAPPPTPVFPADNWWNTDISAAPVDPKSASYIAFIDNGGTRRPHPDFGGEESSGSTAIYGFPYAVVDGKQPKLKVIFDYDDESDGNGKAFYPIPAQAISQAHWIESGAPGTVDQRDDNDRHLLMVDCTNHALYELFSVWYDSAHAQWYAGSGAYFDMNNNDRRPEGWTSADAGGLAIFPGLVRYDEAGDSSVTAIRHAFRVTVRASNGHVFPASHTAGSTSGALPLGARLRLKKSVNGVDPATRTSDPIARKIFRAMQTYGLIVADNGSDLYVSGTFDTRWDNGVLNPAFSTLSADDFEVVTLGWQPSASGAKAKAVSAAPNPVAGGKSATGTVTLSAGAPSSGASVALSVAGGSFSVPSSVAVAAGKTSATFAITTRKPSVTASGTLTASYGGASASTILTVTPGTPAPAPRMSAPLQPQSGKRPASVSAASAPAPSQQAGAATNAAAPIAQPAPPPPGFFARARTQLQAWWTQLQAWWAWLLDW